jgi:hypothetical protein
MSGGLYDELLRRKSARRQVLHLYIRPELTKQEMKKARF